jgi:carbon monoxide dehydrogenase subunit G
VKIEVSHLVPYPQQRVWDVLLDPAVLARVLPGIEKFEPLGGDRYRIVAKLGVGAVRGTYEGAVEIAGKEEPHGYRLRGEGKGTPGWAKGETLIMLHGESGGTRVIAAASFQVGGTIAGVGQRMIETVAKAMSKEFFDAIEREIAGRKETASTAAFGFRVLLTLIRELFGRWFGRTPPHPAARPLEREGRAS